MKNKKGFTLIELLAVIVILAIIALIATPIVLDIISDTRESAKLQSAQFYIDAIEYSIANSVLNNIKLVDDVYHVKEDGNLCIKNSIDKTTKQTSCEQSLEINVKGEKPNDGYVLITNGQISEATLTYENKNIMFLEQDGIFVSDYVVGEEIIFNPGDQNRTWNVVSETKDKVTLMLNENVLKEDGTNVEWISDTDYKTANTDGTPMCGNMNCETDEGPITILKFLNVLTENWNNVDLIDNYSYINNSFTKEGVIDYQKLEIKNGKSVITDGIGDENKIEGDTKARLLTIEEFIKITQIHNQNLSYTTILPILQTINNDSSITYEALENIYKTESVYYKNYLDIIIAEVEEDDDFLYRPDWLFSNLTDNQINDGYFLLSTGRWLQGQVVWSIVDYSQGCLLEDSHYIGVGVRPVIEISKSRLK